MEWNNKSRKRKGSLYSYWGNLKKTNKNTAESNSSQNSSSSVVVSASRMSGVAENVSESPLPKVAETVANVQLNPSSYVTSNEDRTNSIQIFNHFKKKKSCHVEVEIDSKTVSSSTNIEKLEKVLQLNLYQRKKKFVGKLK